MPEGPDTTTILLAAFTGLGLAAACGFRVFVPLLVLGLAARTGAVEVSESFEWVGSLPALIALGFATLLEVIAFYVPYLDNMLDALAAPAAAVAGAIVTTSVLVGMDPWLTWSVGIIAGAGVATIVHVPAAAARGASTLTTGGSANAVVATGELASASILTGMAVFAPIAVPMVALALVAGSIHMARKWRAASSQAVQASQAADGRPSASDRRGPG